MYDCIWDAAPQKIPPLPRITFNRPAAPLSSQSVIKGEDLKVDALVDEPSGSEGLVFYYRVSIENGPAVLINPGITTEQVLRATGLISCDLLHCKTEASLPCTVITGGWHLDLETVEQLECTNDIACCLWTHASSHAGRALAVEVQRQQSHVRRGVKTHVLMRRGECLPCITDSVLRVVGQQKVSDTRKHIVHLV